MKNITIIRAGRSGYRQMWDMQRTLYQRVLSENAGPYLILTEHDPVITIGKSGSRQNLLVNTRYLETRAIDVIENDRGGDITFHGPGQIVGYPIINLADFKKDIHWYLRSLEEVIIKTLDLFGLKSIRNDGLTGVWIENRKICAIGVKTSRWITMHGFALNVNTELDHFDLIVPCGIRDKSVTSISSELGNTIDLNDVMNKVISQFENVFEVTAVPD